MPHHQFDKTKYFRVIENETYIELQKLITFVTFVSSRLECTDSDKLKALRIIEVIKNINEPEKISHFCCCFELHSNSCFPGDDSVPGIYLRTWDIWFECGFLEIRAASYHTNDPGEPVDDQFFYSSYVSFSLENIFDENFKSAYISTDINVFVNDALNYNKYKSDDLNIIETDISVW